METAALTDYLERAARDEVVRWGASDVFVEDLADKFQFLLCHESDLHFKSEDQRLIRAVTAEWQEKGYGVQVSPGPRGFTGPLEWTLWPPAN